MTTLPIETRTAAWKPPTLTKALARTVAKRLDKHWAQTGVKGLGSISHAIAQGVLGGMSQMRDRVDNQAAVKKWSEALSKDDLHKMFRMIEEIKNGKGREQYRMTDDALAKLRAASDDLLPIETRTAMNDGLPLEKAVVEAMAEEMGKSHVWDQGYESMLPSERQKAPKTAASYLDMFFKEKRIPSKVFEVKDSQGITHSIPNQVVIDMIKQTRGRERSSIEDTLRKIDYGNGDVNHFLAHLAKGLAEQYSGTLRFASEQEAEKLQAEAEANEQQAQADRAKAEAAQMREASVPHFQARDVDRKLDGISVSLIEDDYVFILDPQKKLDSRRLMQAIQEGVATELSERSMSRDNPGGDVINDKDIDLDVEWSEDIDDGIPGWIVKPSQGSRLASREASGGLYGYTKGTQRDVEASVRKAQRRALSVAKTLYAKDERSVDFLKAHAKRANSKTARLILAAMKVIGPRVAADKTAAMLPSERHASSKKTEPQAPQEKVAGGLYGHPTKTARLALVACSDLRAYVGEVAYSLHSRRTAKYAKVTGFLKEHGKTSKCAYSRMILDCYPDAPVSKEAKEKYPWDECIADQMKQYDGDKETAEKVCGKIKSQSQGKKASEEMLKAAFVPDSVDGWLEWADGTRTAAHKEA